MGRAITSWHVPFSFPPCCSTLPGTLPYLAMKHRQLIFAILYMLFGNARDASLVLLNVPFAAVGGILILRTSHKVYLNTFAK